MTEANVIAVSVVVPTFDRPQLLQRCLNAVVSQVLGSNSFEVLVVDDAAGRTARDMVTRLKSEVDGKVHLRYLEPEGRGPAAARNTGWRHAAGPIVAFTDDDCIPQPGWLTAGLEAMSCSVGAAGGKIVVPLRQRPSDYELNAANLESAEFVTANCFYRRDVLDELGGFDERFEVAWREDTDLYYQLLERGHRVVRAESAVVQHPVREAKWGVSLIQQRKSQYNALLYKKHPRLYRQKIQAFPPVTYYLTMLCLLSAIAGMATRHRRLRIAGVGGWIFLTARFHGRRLRRTSRSPRHVFEMIVTSALIPPLAIFWRLRGAWRFRVAFL